MRRETNSSDYSGTFSTGNIFPTIGNSYPENVQYLNMNSIYNCSRQAKGHVTNSNPVMTKLITMVEILIGIQLVYKLVWITWDG